MKTSTALWTLEALIESHANRATIQAAAKRQKLTYRELVAPTGHDLAIIGNHAESLVVAYDTCGTVSYCGYRPIGAAAREKIYATAYQRKR